MDINDDAVVEESVESQETETQDTTESPEDSRETTISKITDILEGREADVQDDASGEDDSSDTPEDSGETVESADEDAEDEPGDVIDPRFVSAARAYGWDDTRIQEYASGHDDRDLVMLTGMMERNAPQEVEDDDVVDFEKEKPEVTPVDAVMKMLEGGEDVGDLTKNMIKTLATQIQEQNKRLAEMQEKHQEVTNTREQNQWLDNFQLANQVFDGAAKQLKELGTYDGLTLKDGSLKSDPAVELREQLFDMAVRFHESGRAWRQSLDDAIRWYRGGRDDVVEANVLRKIKANEKRLSPNRSAHKARTKKYADDEERKADVVNTVMRKYGNELPS